MLECRLHLKDETKRKVVYHDHTDGDLEKEMSELQGVVYNSLASFLIFFRALKSCILCSVLMDDMTNGESNPVGFQFAIPN